MLKDEDIETYKRDGVVCLRGVLDAEEIDGLRNAVNKQIEHFDDSETAYDFESIGQQVFESEGAIDAGTSSRFDLVALKEIIDADPNARPLREEGIGDEGGMFFYEVGGWKAHREIRDAALDSKLPEVFAGLMDASHVHFWEDTTFIKLPRTAQITPFHQDLSYFQTRGEKCGIAWIPLDPAGLHNGVTKYVRGSHLWGKKYAPSVFVSQTTTRHSPYDRLPDIEADEDKYDTISFDVEPGDVIVHHVLTVHGAGGNPSHQPRRAISFRYCGDDVRFFNRPGAIPQVYTSHSLRDGDRLFSSDYPVVWPRPWPGLSLADVYDQYVEGIG